MVIVSFLLSLFYHRKTTINNRPWMCLHANANTVHSPHNKQHSNQRMAISKSNSLNTNNTKSIRAKVTSAGFDQFVSCQLWVNMVRSQITKINTTAKFSIDTDMNEDNNNAENEQLVCMDASACIVHVNVTNVWCLFTRRHVAGRASNKMLLKGTKELDDDNVDATNYYVHCTYSVWHLLGSPTIVRSVKDHQYAQLNVLLFECTWGDLCVHIYVRAVCVCIMHILCASDRRL